MDSRTAREFAFYVVFCGAVFVWLLSQTPTVQTGVVPMAGSQQQQLN